MSNVNEIDFVCIADADDNEEEDEALGLGDIEDNTLNVDDEALLKVAHERMMMAKLRAEKQVATVITMTFAI